MAAAAESSKRGQNSIWLIPVILIFILAVGVGGFFGFSAWKQNQLEQQQSQEAELEQQQKIEAERRQRAEISRLESQLDVAAFYEGIWIDDMDLSGLSYGEAEELLADMYTARRSDFSLTVAYEQEEISLDADDASFAADWQMVLDFAWKIGRSSRKTDYLEGLRDRLARIEDIKNDPVYLPLQYTFDEEAVKQQVLSFAESFNRDPEPAVAYSFDVGNRAFNISEQVIGRRMNSQEAARSAVELLQRGEYGQTVQLEAETLIEGYDAATIRRKTGHVSSASTYAYAVNVNRDINISLICKTLNGLVLQPGETFSFNGYIGQRTAAKGYKEAGGIVGGILIEELGGGICQPNTTLCHAVLKAGLEIVERHPHSWPSSYAPIGLDATVSWRGPDFKFRNNTQFPLAIVAWYDKPAINVQVYGQLLGEGVTISLDSAVVEKVPIPEPIIIEKYNEELKPGQRVEIRSPYVGRRAVAWRIWKKDGKVTEREEVFKSYYRPLQGIVEYGPEPVPTPTPEPTPEVTPEPTPELTPEVTPEPTPETTPEPEPEPIDDDQEQDPAPGNGEQNGVGG